MTANRARVFIGSPAIALGVAAPVFAYQVGAYCSEEAARGRLHIRRP